MTNRQSAAAILAACATAGLVGFGAMAEVRGAGPRLTPAAEAAVRQLFPDASILRTGQETERGVQYFEVAVLNGHERIEIEVTSDGSVGEVEMEVALENTPQVVRDEIARLAGPSVRGAERHEIRGVPKDGRFVSVVPPVVLYEVEYRVDGIWKEVMISEDGRSLSVDDDSSSGDGASSGSDDDSSSSDSDSSEEEDGIGA